MNFIRILLVALVSSIYAVSFAGHVIKSGHSGGNYLDNMNTVMYVQDNNIRIDDNYSSIILIGEEYYILFKYRNVYIHGDISELKSDKAKYSEFTKAKLGEGLSDVEKEKLLEIYESVQGDLYAPYLGILSYEKTDDRENISGYNCNKYLVKENEVIIEELWIAEGHKLVNMRKINSFFNDYGAPESYRTTEPYYELQDKGIIMKSYDFLSQLTYKVYEIEKMNISSSMFLPAENMKQISWLELDSYKGPME